MSEMKKDAGIGVRWQQEMGRYSEELVALADETLSEKRMKTVKEYLRTSQLNNLLGVAKEADGPAMVKNWIQYQMGRRDTKRAWHDNGFGQSVLNDLRKIHSYAKEIVTEVYESGDKWQIQKTEIAMIRQYAGYLIRWFVGRGGQD